MTKNKLRDVKLKHKLSNQVIANLLGYRAGSIHTYTAPSSGNFSVVNDLGNILEIIMNEVVAEVEMLREDESTPLRSSHPIKFQCWYLATSEYLDRFSDRVQQNIITKGDKQK